MKAAGLVCQSSARPVVHKSLGYVGGFGIVLLNFSMGFFPYLGETFYD